MGHFEAKKYPKDYKDENKKLIKRLLILAAIFLVIIGLLIFLLLYFFRPGKNDSPVTKVSYSSTFDSSLITSETSLDSNNNLKLSLKTDNNLYQVDLTLSSSDDEVDIGPIGIENSYIYHSKGTDKGNIKISFEVLDLNTSNYIDKSKSLSDVNYEIYLGEDSPTKYTDFNIIENTFDVNLSISPEIYLNSLKIAFKI